MSIICRILSRHLLFFFPEAQAALLGAASSPASRETTGQGRQTGRLVYLARHMPFANVL